MCSFFLCVFVALRVAVALAGWGRTCKSVGRGKPLAGREPAFSVVYKYKESACGGALYNIIRVCATRHVSTGQCRARLILSLGLRPPTRGQWANCYGMCYREPPPLLSSPTLACE